MKKQKAVVMIAGVLLCASMWMSIAAERPYIELLLYENYSAIDVEENVTLPEWEIGNYWVYELNVSYAAAGATANLNLINVTFEVMDITDTMYIVDFSGEVGGSVDIAGIIDGVFESTTLDGQVYVNKENLAIERIYNMRMEGNIKRQLVTNAFWMNISLKQNVTDVVSPFDFPITLFEQWDVPETTFWLTINGEVSLAIPYTIFYDFPVYIQEHTLLCNGKETLRVPAGRYTDVFRVSGYGSQYLFWFSQTANNVIKTEYRDIRLWYNESVYWDLNELDAELLDTNYEIPNGPPYQPSNPTPSNNATDVSVNTLLSWRGGDPDNDSVSYDVYFGNTTNPPEVSTGQSGTTYNPGTLNHNFTYYWRVNAHDENGASTSGLLWTFTTGAHINSPPTAPTITGSTSGVAGQAYEYHFVASDPDGDDVYYWIQWGGGCPNVEWVGPYASGESITITNTWDARGTYIVQSIAKDANGNEGPVGTLQVVMPKTYQNPFLRILEHLLQLFPRILDVLMLFSTYH